MLSSATISSKLGPSARFGHLAVGVGQTLLVWGGNEEVDTSLAERFDVVTAKWRDASPLLGDSLPVGLRYMAFTSDGENAYVFGGLSRGRRLDRLFTINMTSLECRELVPKDLFCRPSGRNSSEIIYNEGRLVTYGGFTDNGVSDELHVFDLGDCTWSVPATAGDKPPGLTGHTLTTVARHKAVLFAGSDGRHCNNTTYLLDMEDWMWGEVQTSGRKPAPRSRHTTCCTLKGRRPLLTVIGGSSNQGIPLSDVWVLDLTNKLWNEVNLPSPITPRWGHSCVVFGVGSDFRVLVLFSGVTSDYSPVSGATLLLLNRRGGSWVVDSVVYPLQTTDESLRKQLRKLLVFQPLSDERAQQIIDKALEGNSQKMRNIVSVITGLMGSGKTCLLLRLFNQNPPSQYTSTGVTEQSMRGVLHHVGSVSSHSLEAFSHTDVLERLAFAFRHETSSLPGPPPPSSPSPSPPPSPPPYPPHVIQKHNSLIEPLESLNLSFSKPTRPSPHQPKSSKTPPSPTNTSSSSLLTSPTLSIEESATQRSIMSLVKVPNKVPNLSVLELVHMIDTGGQPEHMENMPSLIRNCHLAFLVLNLQYGLDEYPSIHYHEKGKRYERALPSQYSTRQIIQKLASTLQAKRFSQNGRQAFRLLVVATHRDRLWRWQRRRRINEYDQILKDILLPACGTELIRLSASQILFDLNLKNPDNEDLERLALIRQKISESGVGEEIQTPSSFLLFEQELLELSEKKVGRFILSLDECLEVGAKLKMNSEMVRAALMFFHRQITFLYFHHILPHVVFTKPQVPLDCINSIVQFSYKVESEEVKGVPQELITSLREGIITEEILGHELLSKCFVAGLYEPCHAIDLLCHTFTLAPLSDNASNHGLEREKRQYLMMCLRQAIPDKDIPDLLPPPSEIAPLTIEFTNNCVPLSCFSRTVSCLLGQYDWQLIKDEDGSPQCLAHNVVSLFKPQMLGRIVMVDTGHNFEVHVSPGKGTCLNDMLKICFEVKETIFTAIRQVFDSLNLSGIKISPVFVCPCKGGNHFAAPATSNSRWYLQCPISRESVGLARECHLMWLEKPEPFPKPTLPKLLFDLNIVEAVGTKYTYFGSYLLNDTTGSLVDIIEMDGRGKTREIIRLILIDWLKGKGQPPTWQTLVSALRGCKLRKIANEIERKYVSMSD